MNMNKYLDIAPEVQQALADGRPVVALESTIISRRHALSEKSSRRPCSSSRLCATTAPCPPPSPSSAAA